MSDARNEYKIAIKVNGEKVGSYGLSFYDDIKAVGIGNLEIYPEYRNKGYGTKSIKNIIAKYKNDYDLIYCFVDADNEGAIRLYKRLGTVHDEEGPNDDGQYYVVFYKKSSLTETYENQLLAEKERIKDVLDIMLPIKYGFISKKDGSKITDREWIHNAKPEELEACYEVNTDPEVTIKNKLGICQDQALAIEYLMKKYHPEDKVELFALTKPPKGHCVACYEHNGKQYYLETSWDKERGLHGPFDSKDDIKNYLKQMYFSHHKNDTPAASKVKVKDYEEPEEYTIEEAISFLYKKEAYK